MEKTFTFRRFGVMLILVAVLLGIFLCGCAGEPEPAWVSQPEVLRAPLTGMMDAVCAGDYTAASALMQGQPDLGMQCPEDELGKLYWDAFVGSISYELVGECYATDTGAAQKIRITYLDLSASAESVPQRASTLLEQRVAEAETMAEIYDESLNYRTELVEEAALTAAGAVLEEDAKIMVVELAVEFVCEGDRWLIVPAEHLLQTITGGFDTFLPAQEAKIAQAVEALEKVFWLDDLDVVAPKPDAEKFGTTDDPKSLQWLVDAAQELLDGQELFFSTDVELWEGSQITYYLDDTILSITWQQAIDGAIYTFNEVKIAHGSQFRRYIADDTYRTRNEYYGTEMSELVNAVTGANGDFYNYKFRSYGTVVYKGEVFRANPAVDVCFVDDKGEMILLTREEIAALESMEDFVAQNNVRFSIAFGPIMVRDGQNMVPKGYYVVGEIRGKYPRACLGSLGQLHYLTVTAGQTGNYRNMPTVSELADRMISYGCDKAYSLDGGQTGMIFTNNQAQSVLNYRYQRKVSDIFYFATAIPNNEE